MSSKDKGRQALTSGPALMTPNGLMDPIIPTVEEPSDEYMKDLSDSDGLGKAQVQSTGFGFVKRELFGGAITVNLPAHFEDVSNIREVPDHQEVYIDKLTEASLIIELLDYDDSLSHDKAASYHYEELVQCNEAEGAEILATGIISVPGFMPFIDSAYPRCGLIGSQQVKKFKKAGYNPDKPVDDIGILLLLLRLTSVSTDLLLTLNVPKKSLIDQFASLTVSSFVKTKEVGTFDSIEVQNEGPNKMDVTVFDELTIESSSGQAAVVLGDIAASEIGEGLAAAEEDAIPTLIDVMQTVLDTLNIVDWSLFA